jgi:hypothetical protein
MGQNRGNNDGMYENFYLHIFHDTHRIIAQADASAKEVCQA